VGRDLIIADSAMKDAARDGEDPHRAACDAFFHVFSIVPGLSGLDMEMEEDLPSMQQRAVAELASWVGSQISLSANRRLNAALSSGEECAPFQRLLEELPAATFVEWGDGQRIEGLSTLVSCVAGTLERLRSESERLERAGKLADAPSSDGDMSDGTKAALPGGRRPRRRIPP
jgi:hypothetical protein